MPRQSECQPNLYSEKGVGKGLVGVDISRDFGYCFTQNLTLSHTACVYVLFCSVRVVIDEIT